VAPAVLPAWSVAVQLTLWPPTLLVSTGSQPATAIPEVASPALGLAVALPLSGTGLGETVGARAGAVASRLRVTLFESVPPSLVAWQVKLTPAVSLLTVTFEVYQPLLPKVPLMLGVMTGAVVSASASWPKTTS